MDDYYQILEVPSSASDAEIQHAYRQLIQVWHPDRFQGNPELLKRVEQKTKQLNESFRHLSDPELRAQHDNLLNRHYSEPLKPSQSNPDSSSTPQTHELKIVTCPNTKCGVGLRIPAKGRFKVCCPRCDTHFMYDASLDAAWNIFTSECDADVKPTDSGTSKTHEDKHWGFRFGSYLGRTYTAKVPTVVKSVLSRPIFWIIAIFALVVLLNSEQLISPPLQTSTATRSTSVPRERMAPVPASEQRPQQPLATQPSPPTVMLPAFLPTGTRIGRYRVPKGRGSLRVINGTSLDAVVKLGEYRKQGKLLASLYLRANEELALKSVGTGTFRLAFTLGTDWNQGARRFNQASFYKTFDESIQFTETKDVREVETESGIEIQTKIGAAEWTFTLQKTV